MSGRDHEPRPQRWSALLLLAGIAGLLPFPAIHRTFGQLEELLLSARRFVGPTLETAAALAPDAAGLPDPRVVAFLAQARAAVMPPRGSGWERDGRFAAVPVGVERGVDALSLLLPQSFPAGEPAFTGRILVGFTALDDDGRTRVAPLTAKKTRLPACIGIPGRREVRCLVLGDGTPLLRVAYPDSAQPIREGDFVWAVDPGTPDHGPLAPFVGGAEIGRIERGDLPPGADRDDWRVRPSCALETLVEVALRFPPGLPAPAETDLVPLPVHPVAAELLDGRRAADWIAAGSERGVVAGCAVASGPCLAGLVARAGWQRALVRRLDDPGFRVRAVLLVDGQCFPWTVEVVRREGDTLLLRGTPPIGDCDGALLVTAGSAAGVPEGLILGVLESDRRVARLHLEAEFLAAGPSVRWVVHRPPGAWSSER